MKSYSSLVTLFIFTAMLCNGNANPPTTIEGAWINKSGDKHIVILIKDGYFTCTDFKSDEFMSSWGGIISEQGQEVNIHTEFNSSDSAKVGLELGMKFSATKEVLAISIDGKSVQFKRIDEGNPALSGVWKISARQQDDKLVPIHQRGSRKTLKILTGSRFQWFAIDRETKIFSGTGGGTYTFSNGKYTEKIDFFSRDNKRVGAQLTFDGKLEDGKWHHSGSSSKGDPIYEVWEKTKH